MYHFKFKNKINYKKTRLFFLLIFLQSDLNAFPHGEFDDAVNPFYCDSPASSDGYVTARSTPQPRGTPQSRGTPQFRSISNSNIHRPIPIEFPNIDSENIYIHTPNENTFYYKQKNFNSISNSDNKHSHSAFNQHSRSLFSENEHSITDSGKPNEYASHSEDRSRQEGNDIFRSNKIKEFYSIINGNIENSLNLLSDLIPEFKEVVKKGKYKIFLENDQNNKCMDINCFIAYTCKENEKECLHGIPALLYKHLTLIGLTPHIDQIDLIVGDSFNLFRQKYIIESRCCFFLYTDNCLKRLKEDTHIKKEYDIIIDKNNNDINDAFAFAPLLIEDITFDQGVHPFDPLQELFCYKTTTPKLYSIMLCKVLKRIFPTESNTLSEIMTKIKTWPDNDNNNWEKIYTNG